MSEKVSKIDERIKALQAEKQRILNREKEQERKKRTRELIEIGAIVEKYMETRDKYWIEAMCQALTHSSSYQSWRERVTQEAEKLKNRVGGGD